MPSSLPTPSPSANANPNEDLAPLCVFPEKKCGGAAGDEGRRRWGGRGSRNMRKRDQSFLSRFINCQLTQLLRHQCSGGQASTLDLSLRHLFGVGLWEGGGSGGRRSGAVFNTVGDRDRRPPVRPFIRSSFRPPSLCLRPLFPFLSLSFSRIRSLARSLSMSKMCREPRYIQNLCPPSLSVLPPSR